MCECHYFGVYGIFCRHVLSVLPRPLLEYCHPCWLKAYVAYFKSPGYDLVTAQLQKIVTSPLPGPFLAQGDLDVLNKMSTTDLSPSKCRKISYILHVTNQTFPSCSLPHEHPCMQGVETNVSASFEEDIDVDNVGGGVFWARNNLLLKKYKMRWVLLHQSQAIPSLFFQGISHLERNCIPIKGCPEHADKAVSEMSKLLASVKKDAWETHYIPKEPNPQCETVSSCMELSTTGVAKHIVHSYEQTERKRQKSKVTNNSE